MDLYFLDGGIFLILLFVGELNDSSDLNNILIFSIVKKKMLLKK